MITFKAVPITQTETDLNLFVQQSIIERLLGARHCAGLLGSCDKGTDPKAHSLVGRDFPGVLEMGEAPNHMQPTRR